jgi:hypothetical protein
LPFVKSLMLITVALTAAALGPPAFAADLVDRNATGVKIAANTKGEALLTYTKAGKVKHVLVWGAMGARTPSKGGQQLKFELDYAGGYGKYHTAYWKTFANSCGEYDGPPLPNLVAACRATDGTYWAAQSWARPLPNLGYAPFTAEMGSNYLEVSHWTGDLPKLEVATNWIYSGRFQQIYGRYTYGGSGVYGFGTTRFGAPTDGFGVVIYLDTYDSVYGPGWRRENSFVPHNPTGVFCYGFFTFDPTKGGYKHPPGQTAKRGPGIGAKYRLTASGPGVTPNVSAEISGLHPFDGNNPSDVDYNRAQTAVLQSWGDRQCKAGSG